MNLIVRLLGSVSSTQIWIATLAFVVMLMLGCVGVVLLFDGDRLRRNYLKRKQRRRVRKEQELKAPIGVFVENL